MKLAYIHSRGSVLKWQHLTTGGERVDLTSCNLRAYLLDWVRVKDGTTYLLLSLPSMICRPLSASQLQLTFRNFSHLMGRVSRAWLPKYRSACTDDLLNLVSPETKKGHDWWCVWFGGSSEVWTSTSSSFYYATDIFKSYTVSARRLPAWLYVCVKTFTGRGIQKTPANFAHDEALKASLVEVHVAFIGTNIKRKWPRRSGEAKLGDSTQDRNLGRRDGFYPWSNIYMHVDTKNHSCTDGASITRLRWYYAEYDGLGHRT